MNNSSVDKFLRNLGMKNQPADNKQQDLWDRVIQPNSSYLIVGDVGTGKSALAYYLLETFSQKYDLLPVVVGFPRQKQELLPPNFIVKDSPADCTELEDSIVFIDEADLQLAIEDIKARKYVINFLSLPRQRHQIFLLAFHFPRLVLGRYLPFFAAFLLKRPPYLIEFASKGKNDTLGQMMLKAEERFAELVPPAWQPTEEQLQPLEVIRDTYVVAPRIRWQGMVENPLCSFWSKELSEVWAGTQIAKGQQLSYNSLMGHSPSPQRRRWVTAPEEIEARPEAFGILPEYDERGILIVFKVQDPEGSVIRQRASIVAEIHKEYPDVEIGELEDARISYFDYSAIVQLKR